ncbi:uncharacterized protein LOC143284568 [Babylonia areolata]|uniref:uncharacterized protein LOC143284568 n=1 Tax=Babylonia areolata TaxID=304850 RepID=UPI003FD142C9
MGNGASASEPTTPRNVSSSPRRNHSTPAISQSNSHSQRPARGNFSEVQVNHSGNHERQDHRSEGQRRSDARQQAALEHQRKVAAAHAQRERQEESRTPRGGGGGGGGGESLTHGAPRHSSRHKGESSQGRKQAPPPANMASLQPDQVVFETFTNSEGKEFICAYRAGKRYYLDSWHSQEWQPFPERWYKEGTLRPLDDSQVQENYNQQSSYSQSTSSGSRATGRGQSDDREGFLKHPKRGRVETYLMEERRYVHFFFDKFSGNWLRLPIGWELHHPLIRSMVQHVEGALPKWKDPADILAMLRVCNYNPDECIGTYLHLEGDEWLVPPKSTKSMSDGETLLDSLKEKVKALEMELKDEKRQRMTAEKQLSELQESYSRLSAEAGIAKTQVEAMQTSRPKTAQRPKTPVSKKPPTAAEMFDPEQLEALTKSAQSLHKSHAHLRMTITSQFDIMKQLIAETASAVSDIRKCDSGSQLELEEIRALYQKEALQRRLLYNQLQELRGNIRVFCRPRKDTRCGSCLKFPSEQDITVTNNDGGKKTFSFDKVYTTESSQEEVFQDTNPIISSCVDGYNVCLMAYGQTGSGKTFTMMGPEDNPGINIRAVSELLKVCGERGETKTYTLKVSMVEIYNETVQDLLTTSAKTLEVHAVGNMVRIPNITEMAVESLKDIKEIMELGDKNRSVAETKMNSTSSRSHLLLRIAVSGTDKVSGAVSNGELTLCDLAGSERIGKTEASGQRLVEAAAINKSLSALGQVFAALRSSQLHVPYRNSKLTQILRPCLGGDAKACVFVNVSPDVKNFAETCNTLEFGSNARQIALGQAKQNVRKAPGGP